MSTSYILGSRVYLWQNEAQSKLLCIKVVIAPHFVSRHLYSLHSLLIFSRVDVGKKQIAETQISQENWKQQLLLTSYTIHWSLQRPQGKIGGHTLPVVHTWPELLHQSSRQDFAIFEYNNGSLYTHGKQGTDSIKANHSGVFHDRAIICPSGDHLGMVAQLICIICFPCALNY